MNRHSFPSIIGELIPVLSVLLILLLMPGCKTDLCSGVNCENGGVCVGGGCDCPDGFTGTRCEIELDPCTLRRCNTAGTDSCIVSPVSGEARCVCSEGYEGDDCQTRWEDKYAGNFSASEVCEGVTGNFPMSIEAGPDPGQITLINFNNKQPNNIPAKLVGNLLTPTAFQIYQQFMPFGEISGQGGYDSDGVIAYSFQVISSGDTSTCSTLLQPN